MYYKVIYNDRVIDVLDRLVFLKYQEKYDRMVLCDESEAQAILSSNEEYIWHEESLLAIPVSGYDTVQLEEIDVYEYKQLKALSDSIFEKIRIIDEFVNLVLINKDMDQLVESLKRLYRSQEIGEDKVIELCENYEITEEVRDYILESDM